MKKLNPYWALDTSRPSSLDIIWKHNINPDVYNSWSIAHKNIITKVCVAYITRIYSFVEMTRELKQVPGSMEDWRILRISLVRNYETVLGIKLMLLRCKARDLQNNPIRIKQEIRNCNIRPNDSALYFNLDKLGLEDQLVHKIYELPGNIPSVKQVRKDCEFCLKETKSFIDKFVERKLRFIYKGNRLQHHDLAGEITLIGVEAFFHVSPFLTELHRTSTFKRAAHNGGIKLIQWYTDPIRARQRKDGNGNYINTIQLLNHDADSFSSTNYNFLLEERHEDTPISKIPSSDYLIDKTHQTTHNRVALKKYVTNHKHTLPVINLLSLKDDNEFIKFSEVATSSMFGSTTDIYDEIGSEKYYKLIADFLNISYDAVEQVVYDLQNSLIKN